MDVNTGKIGLKTLFLLGFLGLAVAAPVTVQNDVDSDSMVSNRFIFAFSMPFPHFTLKPYAGIEYSGFFIAFIPTYFCPQRHSLMHARYLNTPSKIS